MSAVSNHHEMMDGLYHSHYRNSWEAMRRCGSAATSFGLEENLLARAEALVAHDMKPGANAGLPFLRPHENLYAGFDGHSVSAPRPAHQITHPLYTHMAAQEAAANNGFETHMQNVMSVQNGTDIHGRSVYTPANYPNPAYTPSNAPTPVSVGNHCITPHYAVSQVTELDYDPRELEAFAERFKQRRIKLGVTQADVGKALGNLKLPGVGSLSQSTICRFESLTLSHNNMIALKPVLQAWLEEAEHAAMERQKNPDVYGDALDKKRKRTSITDAEKRSLEAYFHVQPRPSSEKIAQIAEKLNLKKNVVRVWFCNQRQKQKRMKFATPGMHPASH